MKSYGQLWERMMAMENLHEAWGRVRRGHAKSTGVQAFACGLEENLAALQAELAAGAYRPGGYVQFRVRDPKPRTISCAPVRDRVVHHALCGVITPLLERRFTEDSYACREGKGTHRGCRRARELARRHVWYCKIDVRHYFDSIEQDKLLALVLPLFREQPVRALIERIVRHPVAGQQPGRGLPIGNLTSQWFANCYLDGFDHFAKEELRLPGYIRYMDDMVLFADSKAACWRNLEAAERWLLDQRGLTLKTEATRLAPVSEGIPFLGLRIFPGCWRLKRERFLRTRRNLRRRERACLAGCLGEHRLQASAASLEGGVRWFGFRNVLGAHTIWAVGDGAASGSNRVKRGGSWNNNAQNCRSANRNNNNPSNRNNNNGFRVASTMLPGSAGSHPTAPESRRGGNEHARPRAAGSAGERRAGASFAVTGGGVDTGAGQSGRRAADG